MHSTTDIIAMALYALCKDKSLNACVILLWYRVVGEEERTSEAHQLNAGLQKQVQQLEAALQELGREHQTLQVCHTVGFYHTP